MTQTIEQLIDDVIDTTITSERLYLEKGFDERWDKRDSARSALLSRIAEIEKERDDWHKMADEMYQAERMKFVREFESYDKFANEYPLYADFSMAYFENHLASVMTTYHALTARYSQHEEEK